MNTQLEEYNLSPINEAILQERLLHVSELHHNIEATKQVFQQYIQLGNQMCKNIQDLAHTFESCTGGDSSLKPIVTLLNVFQNAMTSHYRQVEDKVISPLTKFVNTEIKKAESDGNEATKQYDDFSKILDGYVSVPSKKRTEKSFEGKENQLLFQNWMAINKNFTFVRSLDLVERKKTIEITAAILDFANLLGSMHKYCGISYDKSHDDLETLRAALPWSTNQLSRFEDDTSSLRLTLNGFFNVYMKSFNMPYSNTTENSHEGFLWQKGVGLKKKWGKRYFVVKDGILSVYKHDNIPFESYQLMLSMVKPIDDPERPSCFSLFTANNTKPIVLQALTDYERDHWICIIQNNIQSALDKSGDSQTQEKNQSVDLPNTLPANQTCADCGAPNPTWACINWGTCICIHCGGVHRSLTTAISKVRSLTLDKLDDITLQLFSKIGNVTANSILEANVGQYKINSNSTKEERINFIKMKYVDRAFTAQSPVNLEEAIRTNNYLEVYKAICTRHFYRFPTSLHLAASIGDPMMCHLITLSLENPDIPDNGWTALSYAAYYGKIEAAQTLINDGCRPLPNDQMNHPYRIAMLKQDEEMAAVFLPYWDKSPVNGQLMGPPHKFA